jgi:hypothetical protein
VSEDKSVSTNHEVTVVEAVVSAEEPEEDRAYGEHVRSEEGASCEKVTVVEAAVVADSAEEPEEDRAYGEHVKGDSCEEVTVVEEHVRMDATALIAKRMGIDQGEVESKLLQLHQKGELDGTAGPQPAPDADSDEDNDISLTSKVLEDFEKAEAEAKVNRSQTGPRSRWPFLASRTQSPWLCPQPRRRGDLTVQVPFRAQKPTCVPSHQDEEIPVLFGWACLPCRVDRLARRVGRIACRVGCVPCRLNLLARRPLRSSLQLPLAEVRHDASQQSRQLVVFARRRWGKGSSCRRGECRWWCREGWRPFDNVRVRHGLRARVYPCDLQLEVQPLDRPLVGDAALLLLPRLLLLLLLGPLSCLTWLPRPRVAVVLGGLPHARGSPARVFCRLQVFAGCPARGPAGGLGDLFLGGHR